MKNLWKLMCLSLVLSLGVAACSEGKDELDNGIKVYYKGVINFIDASGEED